MGFLRLIYVSIHFLVTFIYNFHVAFSELLDQLKPMLHWKTPASTSYHLGVNKDENSILQNAGSELKRLEKLPSHVACMFAEKEVNIDNIVGIIQWCSAADISCISLYDHKGTISQLFKFWFLF